MGLSPVEEAYFQAWGKAGGSGRVRRAFSLFDSMRTMLELQVKSKQPGLSGSELTWRTAKRMYASDPSAQRLLDCMDQTIMLADRFSGNHRALLAILIDLGLRFHVTGGVAASYYGDPRFTQDLDIVIDLSANRPETNELLARLSPCYLINERRRPSGDRAEKPFSGDRQAVDDQDRFPCGREDPRRARAEAQRARSLPGLFAPWSARKTPSSPSLSGSSMAVNRARHDVTEMLRRDEDFDSAILKERAATLGLDGSS